MVDSKISIITVCLNCEGLIERTINSVIDQKYPSIQFIVIDGGSSDGTLDVIKRYEDKIDVIISGKDNGIYDAMNKGLDYATGDLIYFLNAGDYLHDSDVCKNIFENMIDSVEYDIMYGDYVYYDNNATKQCSGYRADIPDLLCKGYCHQTIFAKRSVFLKCGKFNTDYRIYADFDWLLRALIKYKQKMKYIGIPVVYYLKGGVSETNSDNYYFERVEVIRRNLNIAELLFFAISYPSAFYVFLKSLKAGRKQLGFRDRSQSLRQ